MARGQCSLVGSWWRTKDIDRQDPFAICSAAVEARRLLGSFSHGLVSRFNDDQRQLKCGAGAAILRAQ